jgi:hypothetical protein
MIPPSRLYFTVSFLRILTNLLFEIIDDFTQHLRLIVCEFSAHSQRLVILARIISPVSNYEPNANDNSIATSPVKYTWEVD